MATASGLHHQVHGARLVVQPPSARQKGYGALSKHYSVTVIVAEVTPPEPIRENGYPTKVNTGPGTTAVVMTERQVKELFKATVSATDEASAYRKAIGLLEVNRPEETTHSITPTV
jgi:hypothetical protein